MPAPPTRPALRVRYDQRRQEMVFAAAKVFATRGYDQTTMQDLARSMGLATGAVYHYFGSKEQLLISICDQLMEPLLSRARELVADASADPVTRLRSLIRLWVTNVIEHRDHMLVFQQERHTIESGAQWRGVRERRKDFERLMEHALADAGAHGPDGLDPREHALADAGAHGPDGLDPRLTHLALLGMVNHTAQWYRPRGRFDAEQIADGYLALVLDGGLMRRKLDICATPCR